MVGNIPSKLQTLCKQYNKCSKLPTDIPSIVHEFGPSLHRVPPGGWEQTGEDDRLVPTHCCFCGQQCGIQLRVRDNKVVGFEPWEDFPFNKGKLCPKGVKRYMQDEHPDRLKVPLQRVKSMSEGFNAFKCDIHTALGIPPRALRPRSIRRSSAVARAYSNAREALGDDIEIAVHCHDEFDEPSAVGIARAVESMNPLFLEDLLAPAWTPAWQSIRRQIRLPLLTGEKLELLHGFQPFIDNQTVDIIHPDLSFAGGFTGVKKVANYAYDNRMPVALHNVGSLVLTYANAHFGSAIHNFYRSESQLGRPGHYIEGMTHARARGEEQPSDCTHGSRIRSRNRSGVSHE